MVARSKSRLSTAQTLTLVTVGVVVAVLATAMIVIHVTLRRTAIETAQDRVTHSVNQLASVTGGGVRAGQARYAPVARDSAIRHALDAPNGQLSKAEASAARAALQRLASPTDSGMPIELWSTDGKRLAFIGDDLSDEISLKVAPEVAAPALPLRQGLEHTIVRDSVQVGTLYRVGDHTMLWVVMPVIAGGRTHGFIAQQRRIAESATTEQTIRELGGNSVAGYYHNADGTVWTTFGGTPAAPPVITKAGVWTRPELGPMLYESQPIPGTPLVLVMEVPRDLVVAQADATVGRLTALSAFLTIIGAIVAFTLGRRVTRPLEELTDAAELVAKGDYTARVSAVGSEEISRLATSFNRMAEQIAESRAGLEKARTAAESGSRAKSDFLASMSHELRTPLNAIGGYAELIEMGLRGPVSDEQRRDLGRIRTSQQHLLSLIGSILDLSRVESGRVPYDLTTIAVDPFLAGLEALVHPQAVAKQQTLSYVPADPMMTVRADREKLRQIMLNLLSNAIRHSPPGARIEVSTTPARAGTVAIQVSDTGPGIPPDRRDAIFEPFVQLDRSFSKTSEGVGLGLAISRDLARGMQGDVTVDSRAGEGACFVVTLPAGVFDENTQMSGTVETPARISHSVTFPSLER